MSNGSMVALFARSATGDFPKEKAIAMIVLFGAALATSLVGLFASDETLASMAGVIGTKNPLAARIVCGLGTVVCGGAVFVSVLALLGKL